MDLSRPVEEGPRPVPSVLPAPPPRLQPWVTLAHPGELRLVWFWTPVSLSFTLGVAEEAGKGTVGTGWGEVEMYP